MFVDAGVNLPDELQSLPPVHIQLQILTSSSSASVVEV
jgi:hypothetical protein